MIKMPAGPMEGIQNNLSLWTRARSFPRSFPAKAFQYLNRHANELFPRKAESAISFFGGSGCFYFVCFGRLFYFFGRQHIMDLFSAILSALVIRQILAAILKNYFPD